MPRECREKVRAEEEEEEEEEERGKENGWPLTVTEVLEVLAAFADSSRSNRRFFLAWSSLVLSWLPRKFMHILECGPRIVIQQKQ
jgi:hypothetical protein